MLPVQGESHLLERIPRKPNSPYEWETTPDISFFGRPANSSEKKQYRIQQGVHGDQESVYIVASNLPKDINPEDRIRFNGSIYSVQSVGYFFNDSRIVNNHIMSSEYIISKCPKGLVLG